MKFHQLFTLFIVLLFLIFPPIFVNLPENQNFSNFSLFTLVTTIIWSILLFLLSEKKEEKFTKNSLRISLLTFILLFYISWIFQKAKMFFEFPQDDFIYNLSKTEKILNCLQIVILCIYEEILYRKFLTQNFDIIFELIFEKFRLNKKNLVQIVSVFLTAILFALAHLYAGIFNVIFAFVASLLLSLCYKKTNNVVFPIIAHILYNLLIYLSLTKF